MPNTLLVSIPRTDYLSHACSQQAHNDSSHAAIFLLSIVKHPSWSIHRARVQSGDVWCGGKKTLSKPWSAKFPTAPGSPKQNGGRPFAVTSNLMILNPKNWLTQDPRSSKIIPKQKKNWSLPSATHVGAHVTVATFPVHYCGMGGSSWTCQGDMPNCLWV